MTNELILLNFLHTILWTLTPVNQIGAGTNTGLRTIPTPAGAIYYVRKFGIALEGKACTLIDGEGDPNCTCNVCALDGTILATENNGVRSYPNTVDPAQPLYLEFLAAGGDVVLNGHGPIFTVTIDGVIYNYDIIAETVYDGTSRRFYLSSTESCYYDVKLTHGGSRHTPAVSDPDKPFFHPYDSLNDGGWGNTDGIEILDSETYSFPYKDDGGTWRYKLPLSVIPCYLYSSDGQIPKIKGIIGADTKREVSGLFNNLTAVFFNENGTNVDVAATGYQDTWHDPYGTFANAQLAATAKGIAYIIYGGIEATVNDGIFEEVVRINGAYTFEPEYGYMPTCKWIHGLAAIEIANINANVNGWTGIDASFGIETDANNWAGVITACTARNNDSHGIFLKQTTVGGALVAACKSHNNGMNGIFFTNQTYAHTTRNCILYGNKKGIWILNSNITGIIENCIIYNNNEYGISMTTATIGVAGRIINNTIYNNNIYGIAASNMVAVGANSISDNIIYNNGTYDLWRSGLQPAITESNYGTNAPNPNNFSHGMGCIITDPEFCKITSPYKLGISADSGAYRTGTGNDDMGAHLRIIEINESDIEINGIQFDGNDQYNNAIYILDAANHTGTKIKWCDILDFQGIGIDIYDDDTDTDAIVSNNKIYNNGDGIKLNYGGNTIEENLIYNNSKFGIWSDYTGNLFNHNIFFGNYHGLYLELNTGNIVIKNCIFDSNSYYGIYSKISLILNYCCITDGYNSNVDVTDDTNTINNPLFVNITEDNEDFHIKTTEGGNPSSTLLYDYESLCKESADDGYDIGAYFITRTLYEDSWRGHQLEHNPLNLNFNKNGKGNSDFEDALGRQWLYGKDQKRQFPFEWPDGQYSSGDLRKYIEFFTSLYQRPNIDYTNEQIKIRMNPLPSQTMDSGTSATVDATEKTINQSVKTLVDDEWKGWHLGIIFDSGNTGSEEFYAGNEVDLSEWTGNRTLNGTVTRMTPGINGTVGRVKCDIPIAGAGNFAYTYRAGTIFGGATSFIFSTYIGINSLTMALLDVFYYLDIANEAPPWNSIISSEIRRDGAGVYNIRLWVKQDVGPSKITAYYPISGEFHLAVILQMPSSPIAADGKAMLYIDGELMETLTGIDNFILWSASYEIKQGFYTGVDVGTSGEFHHDETYIIKGDKMLINATQKKGYVASANWTDDEWIGYTIWKDNNYFCIKDNDSNSILLSDPYYYFTDEVIDWTFEKYFKIEKLLGNANNENRNVVFTVTDDDNELISGTYDWVIRFIECHCISPSLSAKQPRYYWQQEGWKSGFQFILEEF